MDYDTCAMWYFRTRAELEKMDAEHRDKTAPLKEKMRMCLQWMEARAREEGLRNVPTQHGTGYWATHVSASVAAPEVFRSYVLENKAWDLLELRAGKKGVESFVNAHGEPPPGVNYTRTSVFNLRAVGDKGE